MRMVVFDRIRMRNGKRIVMMESSVVVYRLMNGMTVVQCDMKGHKHTLNAHQHNN